MNAKLRIKFNVSFSSIVENAELINILNGNIASIDEEEESEAMQSSTENVTDGNPRDSVEKETVVGHILRVLGKSAAKTHDRFTAPCHETREHPALEKSTDNSQMFELLQAFEINNIEEQISLHKMQRENAKLAHDEANERLDILKIQHQTAETNEEEAQERLTLAKIQRQTAILELQKQQRASGKY